MVKKPLANAGDVGSVPGWGRPPREENGNPLQSSCLENSMESGTWLGYSPWGCKRVIYNLATKQAATVSITEISFNILVNLVGVILGCNEIRLLISF